MNFAAVGDNCVDYYIQEKMAYAGGCSLNFSVYMKELGGDCAYVGAVGEDAFGSLVQRAASDYGVDLSHLHVVKGNTAVTRVKLVEQERTFVGYDEGVLKDFKLSEEDLCFIRHHDFMHTSVYGGVEPYLEQLRKDVVICYDFADKFTDPKFNAILSRVDYAFFSCQEDGEAQRKLLQKAVLKGACCGVATLGEKGSMAFDGKRFYRIQGNPVEVVDTIGAGDSFLAGFMYGISQNMSVEECLFMGTKRAEKTISYFGAF